MTQPAFAATTSRPIKQLISVFILKRFGGRAEKSVQAGYPLPSPLVPGGLCRGGKKIEKGDQDQVNGQDSNTFVVGGDTAEDLKRFSAFAFAWFLMKNGGFPYSPRRTNRQFAFAQGIQHGQLFRDGSGSEARAKSSREHLLYEDFDFIIYVNEAKKVQACVIIPRDPELLKKGKFGVNSAEKEDILPLAKLQETLAELDAKYPGRH